jgi:pimeloyl-ACP methyl ester carboxylesterase
MVIFVADGAGGETTVADALTDIAEWRHFPVKVRSVGWCRELEVYKNVIDEPAQLAAADRLAECVKAMRKKSPDCQIVFVGYSAGARVVLAAAESLPAGSIDRIVVMGSAVSSHYDLRPALRASRGGIDAFFSTWDQLLLTLEEFPVTAEMLRPASAGRVGFHYPGDKKDCATAYAGLRQYPWRMEMGGSGGHFYWATSVFLARMLTAIQVPPL